MPELVDLEVAKENMSSRLKGKRLQSMSFPVPEVLKNSDPRVVSKVLTGKALTGISRVSKILHFQFGEPGIAVHLMLHGDYCWRENSKSEKNAVFIMDFESSSAVIVKDWSRWTKVEFDDPGTGVKSGMLAMQYGIDPLSKSCTTEAVTDILDRKKRSGIKGILMDQSLFAGIGNAYADEILWQVQIHPSAKCGDIIKFDREKALADAIPSVLMESIDIVRDLSGGEEISEQERDFMKVYRKSGQRCPRCGYMIACLKINGRDTFVCEKCQPRKGVGV